MRKSPGKTLGYIIVPVVVPPDKNVIEALEAGNDGYTDSGQGAQGASGPRRQPAQQYRSLRPDI